MNKTVGHRYRFGFAAAMWIALIALFIFVPGQRYALQSPYTHVVLLSGILLTLSFTLLTLVLWVMDRKHRN